MFGRTMSPRTSFVGEAERQENKKRPRSRKASVVKNTKSLAMEPHRLPRVPSEKSYEFRRVRIDKRLSGGSQREVVKSKYVRREQEENAAEELHAEGAEEGTAHGAPDMFSGNFVIMASVIHGGRKL